MDTKPFAIRESVRPRKHNLQRDVAGGAMGAVAGGALGLVAGPPGVLAGAVLGGIVGAIATAFVSQRDAEDDARDRELDRQIGVTSDEIGAPNLEHPAATVGAYSSAASGGGSSAGEPPAEGPIQVP